MQLITIPFSHYNERARWALQHHGLRAHERRYLPMFHIRPVRSATTTEQRQRDGTGSEFSTPVLVRGPGDALTSSTDILHWADATHATPKSSLYPSEHREQIEAFERMLHDEVGPDTRFLAYWFLFAHDQPFTKLVAHNVAKWQQLAFRVVRGPAKAGMRKRMKLSQVRYEQVRARAERALDQLSTQLGTRPYLYGARFTAADLTCACMLAPMLSPIPNYGAYLPADLGGDYSAMRDEARETAIGQHALRMFAEHRPTPANWTVA